MRNPGVDIVLPVHGPSRAFPACARSLVSHTDFARHGLILVADGPLHERARTAATELLSKAGTSGRLLQNPTRRGFVVSVNLGMASSSRDVILLNSDTVLTAGWVEKLAAAAASRERVATVTPFSNFAAIASLPRMSAENAIPVGHTIDSFAKLVETVASRAYPILPTGVGACLYIARTALVAVGLFDEANFGLGYGEENDFCMRAARAGFVHLLDDATFIFHEGHGSFGREKRDRLAKAHRTMRRLHPAFLPEIGRFLRADPLRPFRERVLSALVVRATTSKEPARIAHLVHGWPPFNHAGTEMYARSLALRQARTREVSVYSRIANPDRDLGDTVELLDGGVRVRLAVNNFTSRNPLVRNAIVNPALERDFERFLDGTAPDLIHIHHMAGHAASLALVAARRGVPIVFQLQDWWSLCPRVNLLDAQRSRCDGPAALKCARCLPLTAVPPAALWNPLLHLVRRAATLRALEVANRFVAGSSFIVESFRSLGFLPAGIPVTVLPYGVEPPGTMGTTRPRVGGAGPVRFGVIGSILPHKGIHIAVAAFREIPADVACLTVWGDRTASADYTEELDKMAQDAPISFREGFDEEGKDAIFRQLDVLIVPSIGLESFGIVAREALARGVPVLASRDGALRELFPEGQGGSFFSPGDAASLRREVLRLAADPERLDAFHQTLPAVKGMDLHASEMDDVYAEVLSRSKGDPVSPRRGA